MIVFGVLCVFWGVHMTSSYHLARAAITSVEDLDPVHADQGTTAEDETVLFGDDFDPFEGEDQEEVTRVPDPIYHWNKAMYHFNDKFYFWVLKPVARAYGWTVPEAARRGVRNFFHNVRFPIRFLNCLVQAKGGAAGEELGRFLVNTTAGILGFGDPAKRSLDLSPREEDLGQSLGRWGLGNGFYIVWPLLGPSTLRDSMGLLGDSFVDPVSYVKPTKALVAIEVYDVVNWTSLEIGEYEAFKKAAIDPYVALRDAYIQNRKQQVLD